MAFRYSVDHQTEAMERRAANRSYCGDGMGLTYDAHQGLFCIFRAAIPVVHETSLCERRWSNLNDRAFGLRRQIALARDGRCDEPGVFFLAVRVRVEADPFGFGGDSLVVCTLLNHLLPKQIV